MRRFSFVALIAVGFTVMLGWVFPSAAFAVNATATIGQNCAAGQVMTGGTFTLTNAPAGQQIAVNTDMVRYYTPPPGFTGGTATYSMTFTAPLASPPAVANMPSGWMGNFSLTAATCVPSKAPKATAEVSICGINPVHATVHVTNENPILVKYTVSLSGLGDQTLVLAKNETDEVSFQPLTRGSTPLTLKVSGAGVSKTWPIQVDACAAPPGPAPTTKAPKAMPQTPGKSTTPGFIPVEQSASPTATTSEAPVDANLTGEDDPFGSDNKVVGSWWFWLIIVLVIAAVVVAVLLLIQRRNP